MTFREALMVAEYNAFRETTVRVMNAIRGYPHERLTIGTRASLAFYEVLQSLTLLGAEAPVLTAARITLSHRIRGGSVRSGELIVDDILRVINERREAEGGSEDGLPSFRVVKILREIDRLQDVVSAMPYEINILDPYWFRAAGDSIFRAEAPTLFAMTIGEDRKADFGLYSLLLDRLQERGLIRTAPDGIKLTGPGSILRFTDVFNYVDQGYQRLFSMRNDAYPSGDVRRYRHGDGYRDLHVRRTLRHVLRKGNGLEDVSRDDLRMKERPVGRDCVVVLAIDHSWSMARSRKLQYAKDAAAGMVYAAMKNMDLIGCIAFSDEATLLSSPTRRYGHLMGKITHLRPENETNIASVLRRAGMAFSSAGTAPMRHLIIITDGIPTSGSTGVTRRELEGRVMAGLRRIKRPHVTVSVVCIRDELEESDTSLAKMIASAGRGRFHLVNTNELLGQVLRDYSEVRLNSLYNTMFGG